MEPTQPGWSFDSQQTHELLVAAAALGAEVLQQRPDSRTMPPELVERMAAADAPTTGIDLDEVLHRIRDEVAPYPMGNGQPSFYAWVNSPPHPVGVAADSIASAMNPSTAGGRHSAVHIEQQVTRWFIELLGWSRPASQALMVSGGSAANLTALAAARQHAYASRGLDVRRDGITGRPVVYGTAAAHSCVVKAVEALGIGSANIRTIADVDDQMVPDDLGRQLRDDIASGAIPVAVVTSVGTVNTGAIDPIAEIADICEEHGVWLHVDGAYGGPAMLLLDEYSDVREALQRCDSLALDAHKWLYSPIDLGMVLFRDAEKAQATFSLVPAYLQNPPSADEPVWMSEYSLEQTRPFRALKLWAQLTHLGFDGYRELIRRDIAVADALAQAIHAADDFELVARGLSVVCFRYAGGDVKEIAGALQRGGGSFIATTVVGDETVLRACVVNPLTTTEHATGLLDEIRAA